MLLRELFALCPEAGSGQSRNVGEYGEVSDAKRFFIGRSGSLGLQHHAADFLVSV